MPARIVVLASGSGSLFQALIDEQPASNAYEIVALISDQPAAFAIDRAARAGINVAVIAVQDFESREMWDFALRDALDFYKPDLVVSAGFMRLIGPHVLAGYEGRIINTHPALLPAFPGAHAVRDALAASATVTGSTVHWVDAGMDTGQVIRQESVAITPGDTETDLHEKIKVVERRLLVEVVTELSQDRG